MMSIVLMLMLIPMVIMISLVVGFVWYLNIGGLYHLLKDRKKEAVCSLDSECPPGYICINGNCVLAS